MNRKSMLAHYPQQVLAESRKATDRRAAALAPNTTTLPKQRALFDEAVIAEIGYAGLADHNRTLVKGAYVGEPGGFWVYEYNHVQARWIGWLASLKANGTVVLS